MSCLHACQLLWKSMRRHAAPDELLHVALTTCLELDFFSGGPGPWVECFEKCNWKL